MFNKIFSFFASTKVALVLLALIFLSCVVGVFLPPAVGKEAVLYVGVVQSVTCSFIDQYRFLHNQADKFLRLSQAGTTIFHLGLVLLFIGVVYDQLFFFEGAIRLTEGETLNCAERASYDWVKKDVFFKPID